jgi:hypothetical protein
LKIILPTLPSLRASILSVAVVALMGDLQRIVPGPVLYNMQPSFVAGCGR